MTAVAISKPLPKPEAVMSALGLCDRPDVVIYSFEDRVFLRFAGHLVAIDVLQMRYLTIDQCHFSAAVVPPQTFCILF
jgi:hypothetical protein